MPRVEPGANDANFSVSVWIEKASYFSTLEEAKQDFIRLRAGREYGFGELYESTENGDCHQLDEFNHYK